MPSQTDSAGQPFVDVPTLADEHVRATFVSASKAGYKVDSIRLQIRDASGHLRMGPDVPLESVGPLVAAMIELIRGTNND